MITRGLGLALCAGLFVVALLAPTSKHDDPERGAWDIEALRPGMRGHGLSVFAGSKLERFDVEILGILKNTQPGRDMVLARLAGCNLEKTGVIAGMSGSPVYVNDRLVGALAYAWAFGKEPIAGITPFAQMASYSAILNHERWSVWHGNRQAPIQVGKQTFSAPAGERETPLESFQLTPLQTPLCSAGFCSSALDRLKLDLNTYGLVSVPSGGAAKYLRDMPAFESLRPGAPLAVALVVGDFDMSGIGTVTHVEGSRVWGWGHPFLGLGACALPMYSAHIHAVYPRQTVSFKMGSPMHLVGTLDCDVSTGVSGVLGPGPNMIPVEASMQRDTSGPVRRYACQVAPHRSLFPHLVFGILTNCVDVEGELPEELTAELNLRIELEDQPPLVLHDVISGPALAGTRAPATLYTPITTMLQTLLSAPYEGIAITRITCATRFHSRRSTAEIESARLASDWYAPGDSVHASVILKPYRGSKQRVDVQLALPVELPDGEYTLQISDDATHVRLLLRDHPLLGLPQSRERLLEQQRLLCGVKRSHLVARLAIPGGGLAVEGQELSHLPASVAEQLSEVRRGSGTSQPLTTLVMAREETPYVLQGLHRLKFRVSRQKPRLP